MIQNCEECGGVVIEDYVRSESYCDKCGLVIEPNHPMGHSINDLVDYMNHNNLQDQVDQIRIVASFQGLRAARLEVAAL